MKTILNERRKTTIQNHSRGLLIGTLRGSNNSHNNNTSNNNTTTEQNAPSARRISECVQNLFVPIKSTNNNTATTPFKQSGLLSVITDPTGYKLYFAFLAKEYGEENLAFWAEIDSYKTQGTNLKAAGKIALAKKAQEIIKTYLHEGSPKEVNVIGALKRKTLDQFSTRGATLDLFDEVQRSILELMENDSFRRFLQTETYKRYSKSNPNSPPPVNGMNSISSSSKGNISSSNNNNNSSSPTAKSKGLFRGSIQKILSVLASEPY
jgi:hypothetical protein